MDRFDSVLALALARRRLIAGAATALAGGAALAATRKAALPVLPLSTAYPEKGPMLVLRNRPPLLETPMDVFDRDVFTPNDRFFVRWHWADIPTQVDTARFHLRVTGGRRELAFSLPDLLKLPRISFAVVNQCSGNSRALFDPPVPGAQWGHGAMGNAKWEGVSLRLLLEAAGVPPGKELVRFGGLDKPLTQVDAFEKSLSIDHAMNGEVMVAFAMNGEQLPLLNGFPLRLVVPGWYSTYWVKALDHIDIAAGPDANYWMAKAYQIPATPGANVQPGTKEFPKTPINAMNPRSWITSIEPGARIAYRPRIGVGGIAMGGDRGVRRVELSHDGGRTWRDTTLGPDEGRYSFRRFAASVPVAARGGMLLMARCTNDAGVTQPMTPNWNPGGYMRNCVETCPVTVV